MLNLADILCSLPGKTYWKSLDGTYMGCNAAYAQSLNLTKPSDIVGKTEADFFDKKTAAHLRQIDNQIIQQRIEKAIEEEFCFVQKKPIYDHQNQLVGLLSQSFDISTLKNSIHNLTRDKEAAEKNANTANLYLKNIIDNMPEHFFWMDKGGYILGCNDLQAKTIGFSSADELVGKNIYDVAEMLGWDKSLADAIRQNDLEVMNNGKPRKIMEETGTIGGVPRTFLSYKNPLSNEKGEIVGIMGIAVDITERKQFEQALTEAKEKAELANIAKSQFIMNISHDIRTPFSGILGFAQILEKDETDPDKKEAIGYIVQSSVKLLTLINEVLDLSHIDNNNELNLHEFSFQSVVQEIMDIMAVEFKRKNIVPKIFIAEHIPKTLISDKNLLKRILLNLVGNAIKFTDQGYVYIRAELLSICNTQGILKLLVEDSGIGIPENKFQEIFHQFTRLTPSYNNRYEGNGLGLWIVNQLLQKIGGNITVESAVGIGSKFICTIPFTLPCITACKTTTTQCQPLITPNKQISRILIVEDNLLAQKIACNLLQEHFNCIIDTAESAEKALKLLENTYDLIVMDIGLPGIDGLTATQKIRQYASPNQQARIVGLTAHYQSDLAAAANEAGMNAIFAKPLTIEMCAKLLEA